MRRIARPATTLPDGRPCGAVPRGRTIRSRGQSLVEFALVIPVLLAIVVGVFDIGMYALAIYDVGNAAREGARVAIVDQSWGAAERAAVEQATTVDLTAENVTVVFRSFDLGGRCVPVQVGCVAEVTVSYEWVPVTKSVLLLGLVFPEPVIVSSTSRETVERVHH